MKDIIIDGNIKKIEPLLGGHNIYVNDDELFVGPKGEVTLTLKITFSDGKIQGLGKNDWNPPNDYTIIRIGLDKRVKYCSTSD